MKILIADDSKAMRMIVTRTLRQAFDKHEIIEAVNGREGFEKAQTDEPDLILSDWNMPEMTGIEFLRALRASGSSTPFCFVTSEGSEEMRSAAEAAGALGLIVKPFTADSFSDVLATVVTA